jgi:hypothetical protein
MDYDIAFAPHLHVNSQDFAAASNNTRKCRDLAEAQLIAQPFGIKPSTRTCFSRVSFC